MTKAASYGKLSHRDPDELQAGARIEPTSLKRNPGDFALWKSSKPGEPSWESPWGPGRPGWHIECSAMSLKILGKHFDIHGGGLDLVFPHHENELVQSESFTGVPFASYWMHNGLLTRGGRKISKSDPDTIVLMGDLLADHEPDALRLLLLSSHYRRPIDYGPTRLAEIGRSLQTFHHAFDRFNELTGERFDALQAPAKRHDADPGASDALKEVAAHRQGFLDAMDDDFNTGGAVGEMFEIVRVLNRMAAGLSSNSSAEELADYRAGMTVLKEMTNILGLFHKLPDKTAVGGDALTGDLMNLLIELRARLRKEKHYALADEIRNRLTGLGVVLEDGPEGTRWRVEPKR